MVDYKKDTKKIYLHNGSKVCIWLYLQILKYYLMEPSLLKDIQCVSHNSCCLICCSNFVTIFTRLLCFPSHSYSDLILQTWNWIGNPQWNRWSNVKVRQRVGAAPGDMFYTILSGAAMHVNEKKKLVRQCTSMLLQKNLQNLFCLSLSNSLGKWKI